MGKLDFNAKARKVFMQFYVFKAQRFDFVKFYYNVLCERLLCLCGFYLATICHYFLDGLFFEKMCLDCKTCDRDSSGNPFAF